MYKNPFVSREEKKGQRRINPFCNWNTLIRSNSVTIAAKPHQEPRQISPPRVTQLSYTSAKTPDPTTRACRNLQREREREREREKKARDRVKNNRETELKCVRVHRLSLLFLLLLITRAADNAMINRATINSRFLDRPRTRFRRYRSAESLSLFQTRCTRVISLIRLYCTPYFIANCDNRLRKVL